MIIMAGDIVHITIRIIIHTIIMAIITAVIQLLMAEGKEAARCLQGRQAERFPAVAGIIAAEEMHQ